LVQFAEGTIYDDFFRSRTLIELDLSSNHASSSSLNALAAHLARNSALTSLNIGHNNVSVGSGSLCTTIAHHPKLQRVNMCSMGLAESDVLRLCSALVQATSIMDLNLQANGINSTRAAVALGVMLSNNRTLTVRCPFSREFALRSQFLFISLFIIHNLAPIIYFFQLFIYFFWHLSFLLFGFMTGT
jgi:hypothetical protein